MGKIGKTFTIDIQVYQWLERHAKEHHRKVSYIVNAALRQSMRQTQTWDCPKCGKNNDNEFKSCWSCEHDKRMEELK